MVYNGFSMISQKRTFWEVTFKRISDNRNETGENNAKNLQIKNLVVYLQVRFQQTGCGAVG